MNKILGGLIIVMALVVGIVPLFTDCLSQGRTLTTSTGAQVPMKCHWTSIAEIGVALPLALVGVLTMTSKRKETVRSLAAFGVLLGAMIILFPTVLIGVCANPMMICNMVEKPTLILSGGLAIALSLVAALRTRKGGELAA
jgi:hypothetical protein